MNTRFNIIFIGFLFTSFSLSAQIVTIPDPIFKNVLVNVNCVDTDGVGGPDSDADLNNDGEIQVTEAAAVSRLYLFGRDINSLEGIESFVALTYLNCHSNNLSSLNVSQCPNLIELLCYNNELNGLDVTQNETLEILSCSSNNITSLDVSQNINLVSLGCANNQLSSLNVTSLVNLESIYCQFNQITSLDVSQNPLLYQLNCYFNLLTNLDTTQNPELLYLFCEYNQLTSLELQNPKLNNFICGFNQLTSLDVSSATDLVRLDCSNNQLTGLDVSQNNNLQILTSHDNQLISLDLRNGNTSNTQQMWTFNNPNLFCISVDDVTIIPECNLAQTSGWCKDSLAAYSEECIVGVTENNLESIAIYPNPATNFLKIESNNNIKIETIKIYTIIGKLVTLGNSETNPLDISGFKSGLYFVEIKSKNNLTTKRFIKK